MWQRMIMFGMYIMVVVMVVGGEGGVDGCDTSDGLYGWWMGISDSCEGEPDE